MSTHTATINVLRTLCLMGKRGGRLGVSQVMEDLGVSRATAYRYLSYLESFGLASRFGRGDFILGPEIPSLERAARTGDPLLAAAEPVIGSLCKSTGATVLLEKISSQRRTAVLVQTGRLGPLRLTELLGTAESVHGREGGVRPIEPETALKMWIQDHAEDLTGRNGARDERHRDRDERELLCLVDGERIETNVFARPVLLQGRVVCRLVALVQSRAVGLPDPIYVEEQLRRAALRIEGRLEATL
jgi:hypothetical protein